LNWVEQPVSKQARQPIRIFFLFIITQFDVQNYAISTEKQRFLRKIKD
jgi:hypothetical protein